MGWGEEDGGKGYLPVTDWVLSCGRQVTVIISFNANYNHEIQAINCCFTEVKKKGLKHVPYHVPE